jgi:hypothetical protein
MNYEPNTRQWREGDYVIHDADRKEPGMLMQVLGYDKFGEVLTVYVNQRHWKKPKKYFNPLRYLLDPRRFAIEVPG